LFPYFQKGPVIDRPFFSTSFSLRMSAKGGPLVTLAMKTKYPHLYALDPSQTHIAVAADLLIGRAAH
jgi:hypothetical protein